MKVTTDGCLFGAWLAERVKSRELGGRSHETVLDIGTGTGLLSLMLAQKNPELVIDAIEIDKDASEQAVKNVNSSPWKDRINIINVDVKTFPFTKKYGIVICNPPFYESELKGDNEKKNIAHHDEGLILPELLSVVKKILQPDGLFYLLLPYKRDKEIRKLLTNHEFDACSLLFVRQSGDHDYFRIMVESRHGKDITSEVSIDEIAIMKASTGGYTSAFKKLLSDYYLQL